MPQINEDGSRIDWYSPISGNVIAWHAGTPAEQAAAVTRLDAVQKEIEALRNTQQNPPGANAPLFAQLLKWVLHYPDPSHVYLVDGKPVITFWGFRPVGLDAGVQPLHALRSACDAPVPVPVGNAPASVIPSASVAAPVPPVAVTPAMSAPWWKRWWMWLLLALSALLLLLCLRACVPGLGGVGIPGLGVPAVDLPRSDVGMPEGVHVPAGGTSMAGSASDRVPMAGQAAPAAEGAAASPAVADPSSASPSSPAGDASASPTGPGTPAQPPGVHPPATDPPSMPATPDAQAQGDPLVLPPRSADGNADFLDGDWRVRAGIQDRNTGEPLRLQYQFEKGKGHVTVNRHNGVRCQAPVSASVAGGSLAIDTSAPAACDDGSTYDMPAIQCKAGERNIAACNGQYGEDQFPLTMRQAQP
ncbi:Uncharacterised protein [Bordetella ansorpii]|uniref:Virulence factor n=1 Tax=Bordetella ansorpii TaxID=288768 RepID=A0A157PZX6_9BORD|nr:Uncharacterised protein [Bordetella ansorpii]